MISHEGQFIFFHNAKAAGSSIITMLRNKSSYGCRANEHDPKLVEYLAQREVLWPNHAHPSMIRDYLGPKKYNRYFKFSFAREPCDRLVSQYFYIKQKERKIFEDANLEIPAPNLEIMESESFEHWVLTTKWLPPTNMWFFKKDGEFLLDFVGKSERAAEDLEKIKPIIGIDEIDLPKANVSKHDEAMSYFTPAMKERVREQYREDFEFFGYPMP